MAGKRCIRYGIRFSFELHFERGEASEVPTPERGKDEGYLSAIKGARVLLVEDHEPSREVVRSLLTRRGLVVTSAGNGLEALTALDSPGADFDVVITDMQMPEMDGYETARAIRSRFRYRKLPIIAMTAHAMAGEREKCLAAGMDDYLSKPLDIRRLLGLLERWIVPRGRKESVMTQEKAAGAPKKSATSGELPDRLPGIDIPTALERLDGDRELFRRILLGFRAERVEIVDEIVTHLNSGNLARAANLLHSLRGVAGNLSASRLVMVIQALEGAIRDGSEAVFPALAQELEEAMAQVREGLDQLG
ncbi:MAG: response regulator [Magnetococcales bacterium]|nr:response regulator [Magnetococcales bacterium]